MVDVSLSSMLIRFALGGGAVVASTILARKIGGTVGGIFAAFPAVYLAAVLTISLDASGSELVSRSIALSKGALVGMGINILCAVAVGIISTKYGWKKGLLQSVVGWLCVSLIVSYVSTQIGG